MDGRWTTGPGRSREDRPWRRACGSRPTSTIAGERSVPRLVFLALAVLAVAATAALPGPASAESPQPTPLSPKVASTGSAGLYATLGLGASPGGTDRLDPDFPVLALTLGGSLPIKDWAFVDVAMDFSMASYDAEPSLSGWGTEAQVHTFAVTASFRGGHSGKKTAVFGSAGVGLAYVSLGADEFYGLSSPPVDSTVVPVLTVAGSLEAPAQDDSRFLAELRYSWISADFGSNSGGSLNVGGPVLLLGWKYDF